MLCGAHSQTVIQLRTKKMNLYFTDYCPFDYQTVRKREMQSKNIWMLIKLWLSKMKWRKNKWWNRKHTSHDDECLFICLSLAPITRSSGFLTAVVMKTTLQINYMSFVKQTNGTRRVISYTHNTAVCVFFRTFF